ncbi:hypothetical protein COC42_14230 [Sphingomonas spermidinifaciens]|uniref:Uncharacterized protein n=1 Tax=Sphingomonas spermidinifaciens TaxID=1141889 RepID=A0A2A4B284_9SPHN|nr:hypothetical protein [Sphingomonas spermidinifaciens]PCD02561.1 hypothetical protein COC42_14230 [Sphingomonas spermidinifaciens]
MIALAALALQAAVFPQQGAIGLAPPPDMRPSAGFTGFENDAGDSILIAELPREAYAELVRRIAATPAGQPLPNGVTLDGAGTAVTLAGGVRAMRWRGHQSVAGTRFAKWLLLAEGLSATAIVTAQVAEPRAAASAAAIEAALGSVRFQAPAGLDAAITALPFIVADRAGFRPVRTLMGSALMLTEGPRDTDPDGAQPLAIVAASVDARPILDPEASARHMFGAQTGFTRIELKSLTRKGDTVVAAGTAVDRARVVAMRQHLRLKPGGGYIRTVCIWPVADDLAARCDALAGGVRPK